MTEAGEADRKVRGPPSPHSRMAETFKSLRPSPPTTRRSGARPTLPACHATLRYAGESRMK